MLQKDLILQPDLELAGPAVLRTAVRAVIETDEGLLMVFSPINGDYKFPGGGIEEDESHADALRREVLEECGRRLSRVGPRIAHLTEYDTASEADKAYFRMDSHYYRCELAGGISQALDLDAYEADLEFAPEWTTVQNALEANRAVLRGERPPRWTARETFFLQYLADGTTPSTPQ